ncbi:unnamed protein product, partial [Allacma fusca]
MRYPPK